MSSTLAQLIHASLTQGTIPVSNMEEQVCQLSYETNIHPKIMERFLLFLQHRLQFPVSPFLKNQQFCSEGFSEMIDDTSTQNGFLIPLLVYVLPFVELGYPVKKISVDYRCPSPSEVCHRQYFTLYDFEEDTSHLTLEGYIVMLL